MECKQTVISIHRLTTSDDYQFINAMAAVWTPYQCRCCGGVVLNHRDRRVLTSNAAHTNCLLQLIGKEWAYLAPAIRAKKGLDKNYKSVVLLSLR